MVGTKKVVNNILGRTSTTLWNGSNQNKYNMCNCCNKKFIQPSYPFPHPDTLVCDKCQRKLDREMVSMFQKTKEYKEYQKFKNRR